MGSYDGVECCELIGLYMLKKLAEGKFAIFPKAYLGLYRNDGLAVHEGAFWAYFVRISTIKQNIDIFGNFLGKIDQIPEEFCYYLLLFEILSLKV